MKKRVLIVGGGFAYSNMFLKAGYQIVNDLFDADLICFTGGEDVTPEIYWEENTHSGNNFKRDLYEAGIFAIAQRMNIPMVGICRGGQFLNVMCGGKMVQHIEGHALGRGHIVRLRFPQSTEVKEILCSSTHHQLMLPNLEECEVLGWAHIVKDRDYDAEVVHYYEKNVLCFQPHPEFDGFPECTELFFNLIEDLL